MGRRRREAREDDYFVCPHCGAELSADARFCPECGSDDTTGWSEDAAMPTGYGAAEGFDYEEFLRREFPQRQKSIFGLPVSVFWVLAAALIAGVLFVVWALAL